MQEDKKEMFFNSDLFLRDKYTSDEVYIINNLLCTMRTIREVPKHLIDNSPGIKFNPNSYKDGE